MMNSEINYKFLEDWCNCCDMGRGELHSDYVPCVNFFKEETNSVTTQIWVCLTCLLGGNKSRTQSNRMDPKKIPDDIWKKATKELIRWCDKQ